MASGTDLGTLAALNGVSSLRLRARLATTVANETPRLGDWTLAWQTQTFASVESAGWTSLGSSIQDATAPALAVTSPTTVSTASYTLAGTASDANGIASLTVNGQPASTSNGYSAWSRALTLVPGANLLTLLASDTASPANTRSQTFTVTYRLPDTDSDGLPDAWENAHSLDPASALGEHGRLGDPDRDGLPNLLEYATGLDPRARDSAPTSLDTAIHPDTGATHLVFTYRRLLAPGDLTYSVVVSSDLSGWDAPPTAPEVLSVEPHADGVTETVVLRLNPALGAHPCYVRLRVDAP